MKTYLAQLLFWYIIPQVEDDMVALGVLILLWQWTRFEWELWFPKFMWRRHEK